MKVWEYSAPHWGYAFRKISYAMRKHSPSWVEWTDNEEDADVRIVHIVGPAELEVVDRRVDNCVLFQQCYYTARADTVDYPSRWKRSILTTSFHNLPAYTKESFPFYRTRLGADDQIYRHTYFGPRSVLVFSTGHIADDECLNLVLQAARRCGGTMWHTGENFKWGSPYEFHSYMEENELVRNLNHVSFTTGLRREEGFEMLCVEGLMCGARAIVPDLPTYDLYEDHAEYIDMDGDIAFQLYELFRKPTRPLHQPERDRVRDIFSWRTIIPSLFEQILEHKGRHI